MVAAVRREIVPVGVELRTLAWLGVMMISTGVGILIYKHRDQIGALAIAIALGALAAACYVWVSLRPHAPLDDYVILLGALLISADAGFIETQFHVLGGEWQRHFLLLAIVHAATAYWFDSRAVLSLSIVALAAWLGVEQRGLFNNELQFAARAFICAGVLVLWRVLNRRPEFAPLFDQFAINLAFWGSLILTAHSDTKLIGLLVTLLIAAGAVWLGFHQRRELFLMYAFVYTIIAINIVVAEALLVLVSTVAGIAALFVIHAAFQKRLANA